MEPRRRRAANSILSAPPAGGPANNPPVNPEVLKSVEAGMKSEWLDHHLQVNLSAFHYDVSNLQMAIIVAGGTKLINAASAKVNGGELSVKAIPMNHLTLSGGFIDPLRPLYELRECNRTTSRRTLIMLGSNIARPPAHPTGRTPAMRPGWI